MSVSTPNFPPWPAWYHESDTNYERWATCHESYHYVLDADFHVDHWRVELRRYHAQRNPHGGIITYYQSSLIRTLVEEESRPRILEHLEQIKTSFLSRIVEFDL